MKQIMLVRGMVEGNIGIAFLPPFLVVGRLTFANYRPASMKD
jgi:hypothetical protein